jgi:SAM-dependent methyltransferase
MSSPSYSAVTEISGERISQAQLRRQIERYRWAAEYCRGRDVLDIACGTGAGLGIFSRVARRLEAADIDPVVLSSARRTYGERIPLHVCDAEAMTFGDSSFDVVVMFEAIYYLRHVDRFIAECRRVLRPGGTVLIATANKDLYDFTPSPLAHGYFNAVELSALFAGQGFDCRFFGGSPVAAAGGLYRLLRPVKALATGVGLMPKTMRGKQWLKRAVFGSLVVMPSELTGNEAAYDPPTPIEASPDVEHHVLYCVATRGS